VALSILGGVCLSSATAQAQGSRRAASEPQSRAVNVSIPALYPVGAIVIVNNERKLYYVTGKGEAIRYGVAVGKNAELWMGKTFVTQRLVDPRWVPVNGDDPVEGGDPKNPLGKRALYLDWSLLRIHGTPSRGSIGSAVSNGCVRMLNEDVIDLFERVHIGAPVYAIRSWADASRFEQTKVGQKIYVDPEAHREAKEALRLEIAEKQRLKAEEERWARQEARGARFAVQTQRPPSRSSGYVASPFNAPPRWMPRSALGSNW
jgi:hypothetical protein